MSDTIYACATAPGRAALTVIRLSGPRAGRVLELLSRRNLPVPRRATLTRLFHPADGEMLDQALVLWFPGPTSYTGEDLAEFQLHGGRAVQSAVLEALGTLEGLRPAEPGEFTRRAFENQRLDLTEAEAVADLTAAETAAQRQQALRQMGGELNRLYEGWRGELVRCLAHLEAEIDFPDEDLPSDLSASGQARLQTLAAAIASHLDDGRRGERLRDGVQVAIIGAPNSGKSSLLNLLARREVAIVSTRSGTTRDVIEVHLDLGGVPVILADTAGLRETDDEIEQEGIRRARERARQAEIRLALFDATSWPQFDEATLALIDADTLVVINKADLNPLAAITLAGQPARIISLRSGAGVEELIATLTAMVQARTIGNGDPVPTRARHRQALETCRNALLRALAAPLPELAAEDLRLATRALGRITGRVEVDELLDVIFRDFCIGK